MFTTMFDRPNVPTLAACVLAMIPAAAAAQAPEPAAVPAGPLSLEQVLSLAEPRSEAVSIAMAGISRADGDQVRARSGQRPQLTGSASYDRALASEFEGVFDNIQFPGGGGGTEGGLEDLPFGRANTWRATLSFSQSLYSGGRYGAQITLAAVGREAAGLGLTTARAQLQLDVTQAYFNAVLAQRLVTIATATLEQANATLRQVEASFKAGTQPEFEVLRARVSRDGQLPILIRRRVDREVAYLRLKQMLELPADYDLQLADALGDENLPPPSAFAERVTAAERSVLDQDPVAVVQGKAIMLPRIAVTQADTTVRQREASLRLTEAQAMPSVALLSTYSRIGYPNNAVAPTFDRSNWTVGATVSVPILTGGRQKGDERVAKAELEQSQKQRQQVDELAALETRGAWAELFAARAAWEATAGTVQQANRAYEIAEVRYKAGVSTQLELSDARVQLQQAEANRALAARDLQVARARVALLPELPLSGAGGAAPPAPQAPPPVTPAPTQPSGSGQFRNAFQ
jgi:outer membrane protein TolC